MPTRNLEKLKEQRRRHYLKHRDKVIRQVAERRASQRKTYDSYKADKSCQQCGESHPACLDFHHRDPTVKTMRLAVGYRSWSEERMMEEIAKCDILCSNCHRKLHWREKYHDPEETAQADV